MSDLYQLDGFALRVLRDNDSMHHAVPVEPVGTLTVDATQFITDGPLWAETQTTLPPGKYDIVPRKADDGSDT